MSEKRELLRATPLRIGISTRALFNLEEEHSVFVNEGVRAYAANDRYRRAKMQLLQKDIQHERMGYSVTEAAGVLGICPSHESPRTLIQIARQQLLDRSFRSTQRRSRPERAD
jgi:5'-nucleotidase